MIKFILILSLILSLSLCDFEVLDNTYNSLGHFPLNGEANDLSIYKNNGQIENVYAAPDS